MHQQLNKKAAIELSIGTIVIIVLAMSMLILGLILIKNIFSGATGATDLTNDNVKAQINKLFNDNQDKTVVFPPGREATVKKGSSWNIAFAVRNTYRDKPLNFKYKVYATETDPSCRGFSTTVADSYIILGAAPTKPITIAAGDEPEERTIVIRPSETAPLCQATYDIQITDADTGLVYDTTYFIVKIIG